MFALFERAGSAVYYIASVYLKRNRNVASTIGLAYGLGIMFQFATIYNASKMQDTDTCDCEAARRDCQLTQEAGRSRNENQEK